MTKDVRLVLDNIRSVHNVGSIFRTAETLGISHIYCVGTTPVPVDRFGRKRKDLAKVSLGAEDSVKWSYLDDAEALKFIKALRKENCEVIALEQAPDSADYKNVLLNFDKILVILGNEVKGVSKTLLKECDEIAEIRMRGKKESLNVSVAAGIALFRWFDC